MPEDFFSSSSPPLPLDPPGLSSKVSGSPTPSLASPLHWASGFYHPSRGPDLLLPPGSPARSWEAQPLLNQFSREEVKRLSEGHWRRCLVAQPCPSVQAAMHTTEAQECPSRCWEARTLPQCQASPMSRAPRLSALSAPSPAQGRATAAPQVAPPPRVQSCFTLVCPHIAARGTHSASGLFKLFLGSS